MKVSAIFIEGKVERTLRSWENSCPEQSFAEMTLEQFRQSLRRYFESKAKFAAADTAWYSARQERNTAYAEALHLTKGVVNSVKGHPKYGEDSAVYTAMGYVPKSERSSGLTRKRQVQAERRADTPSPTAAADETA